MRFVGAVLKLMLVLFGLGTVAVIAGWVTTQIYTGKSSVEVPEIVGLEMTEAMRRLDEARLRMRLEEDDDAHDSNIPIGHVLRQRPRAHALVKQDREVKVLLSLGSRSVYVPRVVGEPAATAQMRINEAGLRLGQVVYVASDLVPEGVVIDQQPTLLTDISNGQVNLLVSSGLNAAPFVMPDLLGKRALNVRSFLEDRRFRVRMETETYDGVPDGTIVRQKPLAGYLVRNGDTIWLWSSRTSGG